MNLISCQNLSKSFGSRTLFDALTFGVFSNDKIGLIGPNGSGKSTLLKILAGLEDADDGLVVRNRYLKVGYVPQETNFPDQPIRKVMEDAINEENVSTEIAIALSKMGFQDPLLPAGSLSGGWKKRLALAIELVRKPDVLLLDEPTNHLDLAGVLWLEEFLNNAPFAYIVISHDRYFLENTTNRMLELNKSYPKGLFASEGSYSSFLEKREEFLKGQVQQERSLSSKVRREIEWLKQNPKARTTKSTSRIQEAERLIGDLAGLKSRNQTSVTELSFSSSKRESKKLLVATSVSKSLGGKLLFSGIDLTLTPGMRLGVVGENGSGKTTLLKIFAGELLPDSGTVKTADGLKIVYFDQHRTHLPSDIPLRRALAPNGDTVQYQGQTIHVNAWCRRFLFSQDRLDLPFGRLSGGEKARVHIARLMLQPADILFLDEPTNDLDIPTLEILEDSLAEFPGALVLISHDRFLLGNVSTLILGLDNKNGAEFFADFRKWEERQVEKSQEKPQNISKKEQEQSKKERTRKMTFSEKREWEQMESSINALEKEINALHDQIEQGQLATDQLQTACLEMGEKQKKLDSLYHRWQELESFA